ncbi:MAG: histidine kinase, partial [Clostridia bacterium]|nr:histidine kinase [Clostridia bacterium]
VMTAGAAGGMGAGQMPGAGNVPGAGQMPGAGNVPGAGNPTDGAGEQKKPTGYVYIGSANPVGGKSGYVHLSNVDLKKPGGNGGK